MYNPELASFIGLTLADVVVTCAYIVFLSIRGRHIERLQALILYLLIKSGMNYYFAVYLASVLLLSAALLAFHEEEGARNPVLLELPTLIIASSCIHYAIPLPIVGVMVEQASSVMPSQLSSLSGYVVAYDVSFGAVTVVAFTLILSRYFIALLMGKENLTGFLRGFAFASYVYATVGASVLLGDGSHLVYGLAISFYSLAYLALTGDGKRGFVSLYAGALMAADDFIGYLLYPQYSPFSEGFVVLSGLIEAIIIVGYAKLSQIGWGGIGFFRAKMRR